MTSITRPGRPSARALGAPATMLVVAALATLAVLAYVVMGLVVLALAAGPFLLVLLLLTRWAPGPPGAGRPRRSR